MFNNLDVFLDMVTPKSQTSKKRFPGLWMHPQAQTMYILLEGNIINQKMQTVALLNEKQMLVIHSSLLSTTDRYIVPSVWSTALKIIPKTVGPNKLKLTPNFSIFTISAPTLKRCYRKLATLFTGAQRPALVNVEGDDHGKNHRYAENHVFR